MTSLIVDLSFKKAVREMLDVLTCKGMMIIYFWSLIAFSVITGIMRLNLMVLMGFIFTILLCLAMVLFVCFVLPFFRFLNEWLFQGGERTDCYDRAFKKGQYKPGRSYSTEESEMTKSELLFFIVMFGIIPALSSFIISANKPFTESVTEFTIVNEKVLPIDASYAISSPFAPVTRIARNQSVVAENLEAMTKDGTMIRATVNADLKLEAVKEEVLFFKNRRAEFDGKLKDRLQTAFAQVVSQYTIETIPGDLLLLSHLIHQESLNLLEGIPLVWSGEFSVTKPKIYHKTIRYK
jgi:hypothetical protein